MPQVNELSWSSSALIFLLSFMASLVLLSYYNFSGVCSSNGNLLNLSSFLLLI